MFAYLSEKPWADITTLARSSPVLDSLFIICKTKKDFNYKKKNGLQENIDQRISNYILQISCEGHSEGHAIISNIHLSNALQL